MSVLAIQPGATGDLIVTLPALRALRELFGADGMEIWAARQNLPLLQHDFYCDRARALADTGLDSYPLPERTLEAWRAYDVVVSWRGSGFSELVDAAQAAHPRAFFLPQLPQAGQIIHMCDFRRAQMVELFGAGMAANASLAGYPRLAFHPADEDFARALLAAENVRDRPVAVLHAGASGPRKRWPASRFGRLAARLAADWNALILLHEGPLDATANDQVVAACPQAGVRRLMVEDLRRVAAVLAQAALFVGNDSGIAHLAAAAGAPVFAIFQAADSRVWAPRGPRVRPLASPSFDEVLQAARDLIEERNHT